jgi:poly(hydroxyalkanoate) depolymerase family esterase
MKRRSSTAAWTRAFQRGITAMTRLATASGKQAFARAMKPAVARRAPPPGAGTWTAGVALGATGARRFRLYRPPDVAPGERLPLLVMLHGCGQDANAFATSTRMNRIALRERFLVLYPEQDRLANPQGCWNWFDTANGRAQGEAALIMQAVDQVCALQPVDRDRIAVAGLSAGASMAALLVMRYPGRFQAVVMHSGIPPGTAHSSLSALGAMHGHRPTRALPVPPADGAAVAAPGTPLLVIHGSADAVVSPRNGVVAAQVWALAAGASAAPPRQVRRGRRYPATLTDFRKKGRTLVTLVAVDGLAHAWSGGAAGGPYGDARGPDASRMAWAFVARQFRGAAAARAAP